MLELHNDDDDGKDSWRACLPLSLSPLPVEARTRSLARNLLRLGRRVSSCERARLLQSPARAQTARRGARARHSRVPRNAHRAAAADAEV